VLQECNRGKRKENFLLTVLNAFAVINDVLLIDGNENLFYGGLENVYFPFQQFVTS
jgi:hypothetical protein